LREGFAVATGDVVCFIDADGDIDPVALTSMASLVRSGAFDIVYGSKVHPESNVTMSPSRKLVSWVFRTLVRSLFRIDVRDTQSGVKAFRGEFVQSVLPLLRESGFNLDLEMFVLAKELGFARFAEHPILLHRSGETTVRPSTLVHMFISTMSMFWRVHLALDYSELIENRTNDQ
jgi:glycosyltransferase involved in cell wall biosynthesis